MNLFIETVIFLLKSFYYIFEGILKSLIPQLNRQKSLKDETVLVTGAGSGIGRLLSLSFARQGSIVVIWDVNKAGNDETAQMIKDIGGQVHAYACDLSKKDDIFRVANKVREEVGDVDILVNNAGIVTGKHFLECSDNLMMKTMDVNATAHFWTTKCFLPSMLERNHGHLVTIASSAGLFGVASLADYCASKFAAVGFDEAIRHETLALGKSGVHTTVVCPYFINTGMFDGVKTRFPSILPILEPDWVVDQIMFAVQINKPQLILPKSLGLTYALKGILPSKCSAAFMEFFGISVSMDKFTGRQKAE